MGTDIRLRPPSHHKVIGSIPGLWGGCRGGGAHEEVSLYVDDILGPVVPLA